MGRRFYYYIFKNNLVYAVALALLRVIELFLRPLPLRTKFSFGRMIGELWHCGDMVNRELCRRDMAMALGATHSVSVRRRALKNAMANLMAY